MQYKKRWGSDASGALKKKNAGVFINFLYWALEGGEFIFLFRVEWGVFNGFGSRVYFTVKLWYRFWYSKVEIYLFYGAILCKSILWICLHRLRTIVASRILSLLLHSPHKIHLYLSRRVNFPYINTHFYRIFKPAARERQL